MSCIAHTRARERMRTCPIVSPSFPLNTRVQEAEFTYNFDFEYRALSRDDLKQLIFDEIVKVGCRGAPVTSAVIYCLSLMSGCGVCW